MLNPATNQTKAVFDASRNNRRPHDEPCHGHCTGYGTHACCPPMIVLAARVQTGEELIACLPAFHGPVRTAQPVL